MTFTEALKHVYATASKWSPVAYHIECERDEIRLFVDDTVLSVLRVPDDGEPTATTYLLDENHEPTKPVELTLARTTEELATDTVLYALSRYEDVS